MEYDDEVEDDEVEDGEVEDGEVVGGHWTLNHLLPGVEDSDSMANEPMTRQLVDEYYDRYFGTKPHPRDLNQWVWKIMNIPEPRDHANINWNSIGQCIEMEAYRYGRLRVFCHQHGIDKDEDIVLKMRAIDTLNNEMRKFLLVSARIVARMGNDSNLWPPTDDPAEEGEGETMLNHDKTKLNPLQSLVIKMLDILAACNYRRADGKFYKRVVTQSGIETQSFKAATEVEAFVNEHTRIEDNFESWKESTENGSVHSRLIDYLKTRPLSSAADLVENCHLRSYEGDAYGRGAVIYDAAQDMAWPMRTRQGWDKVANEVNRIRRNIFCADAAPVTPPKPSAVCVMHMKARFPYDVHNEMREVDSVDLGLCWRESDEHECRHGAAHAIASDAFGATLHALLPRDAADEVSYWGASWQEVASQMLEEEPSDTALEAFGRLEELHCTDAFRQLVWDSSYIDHKTLASEVYGDVTEFSKITMKDEKGKDCVYVPLLTPARRVRARLDEWPALPPPTHLSYVTYDPGDAHGLNWKEILEEPKGGMVLQSEHLVEALRNNTVFTENDWNQVSTTLRGWKVLFCKDLTSAHYVTVNGVNFQPYDASGLRWRYLCDRVPVNGVELQSSALVEALRKKMERCTETEAFADIEFDSTEWQQLSATLREWNAQLHSRHLSLAHFINVDGVYFQPCDTKGVRYFRVHTGRTWRDCATPEVDHIFKCQKFCVHDRFMIYACMGRTLFEVGEFDKHQFTLFLEGIGGCGKSTLQKLMQEFWPFHLIGIMSSNMEEKFGMSQVLREGKTRVIFCNEVSSDLKVVQEEWQTSCSGEVGSYAVKNQAPLVCVCLAQQFWVGNGYPTHFKNGQQQVSRRLAGVLMGHPVNPRDGNIYAVMETGIGYLNRRLVLAYREFIFQQGSIDPMSQVDKLPPAFKEYYIDGRRQTDVVEAFLREGIYVEVNESAEMLATTFKDLLKRFVLANEGLKMPLCRVGEDKYRSAFAERGITVTRVEKKVIDGVTVYNQDFVKGVGALLDA